jgi:hypothetical protein
MIMGQIIIINLGGLRTAALSSAVLQFLEAEGYTIIDVDAA